MCLLQLLTEEFYSLQTSAEKRVAELRAQNAEQASRLEAYEHLEQELDQATLQAAEGKNRPRSETAHSSDVPHTRAAASHTLPGALVCLCGSGG